MRYPHRWTVSRSPGGSQDSDTGAWSPGPSQGVYDGPADCQDEGEEETRDGDGRITVRSVARLFLSDERALSDHQVGDVGTVTWKDGSSDEAEVVETRRMDGSLKLRWL